MSNIKTGEYIDGSVYNANEFNIEIIKLAKGYGFDQAYDENDDLDIEETANDAIDWLNDNIETPEGYFWGLNENWLSFGIWKED